MTKAIQSTKVKDKDKETIADKLNQVPVKAEDSISAQQSVGDDTKSAEHNSPSKISSQSKDDSKYEEQAGLVSKLFDQWNKEEVVSQDFQTEVSVNSMEAAVGYTSLARQMQSAYERRLVFHLSEMVQ
jgi:hypothetical protein